MAEGGDLRERGDELRALAAAAHSAASGTGRLVVVEGVAGVGKTSLLRAATPAAGLRARAATGAQLELALPFGVALGLLAGAREDEDALAGAGPAAALLRGDATAAAGPGLDAQMAIVHGLHRVVANLAERAPLALLVDDLHWVDTPSLRLLAYLGRRVADFPLLIVTATRPAEPGADQALIDELARLPHATVLRPAPLSAAAAGEIVDELMGGSTTSGFRDACAVAAAGNPLCVRELVRALATEGVRGGEDGIARVRTIGAAPVAWSVDVTLRALPPEAGTLVRAVAVLGAETDLGLACALAGVEDAVAAPVLGDLQRAGILAPGDWLAIAHPLVAQSVLDAMPAVERGLLRRRAARLLADRAECAAAATHLVLAPPAAESWAVEALLAAAQQATARAAPAEAARLLERALREPPRADRLPAVLAASARARATAGDPDAVGAYERAIEAEPDPASRAALLLALAWTHQTRGRFAEAVAAADRGLAVDGIDEQVAVELAAMHDAAVLWSPSDSPAAVRGLHAARAPTARAERVALADAARRRMFAGDDHWVTADLARRAWHGGTLLRESTADDPVLVRVLTVLHNADALTDALAVADACLRDARERSSPMAHATWRHLRGHVLAYIGSLEEAEHDLREAFAARAFGWGAWLPVTASALMTIRLERDDPDGAAQVLAEARASTTHPAESPMWTLVQAAEGRLALARGDAATAVEELLAAGNRARVELGADNPALGPWRADAVLASRRLGRDEEALALADVELRDARRWGAPRALAAALRVRGLAGPAQERIELLRAAVDTAAPSGARLEYAHALVTLGEALLAVRADDAADTLRAALDLADRCGAEALAARATRGLHDLGQRPRRRRTSGPDALTIAEQRVAALARSGLSNRQIADELFVTPKTVAFHLGNVYRKLGASGRGDLR